MDNQNKQDVQIVDFEELLQYIEQRLAKAQMKVGRDEIITILQAEEAFLMEKGLIEELTE